MSKITDNPATFYPGLLALQELFLARGIHLREFLNYLLPGKTYQSLLDNLLVEYPVIPFNDTNANVRATKTTALSLNIENMSKDIISVISEPAIKSGLGALTNNKPFGQRNANGQAHDPFVFLRDFHAAASNPPSRVKTAVNNKIPQIKIEGTRGLTRAATLFKEIFEYNRFIGTPIPQDTQLDHVLELFPPVERGLRRMTYNQMLIANDALTVIDFMDFLIAEDALTFPDTQPADLPRDLVNLFIPGVSLLLVDQLASAMSSYAISTSTGRASTDFRSELCSVCVTFARNRNPTNKSAMMMVPCGEPNCNGYRQLKPSQKCLVHPNANPPHNNNECTSTGNLAASFIKSTTKSAAVNAQPNASAQSAPAGFWLFDSCSGVNLVDSRQALVLGLPGTISPYLLDVGGVAGDARCVTQIDLKGSPLKASILPGHLMLDYPILSEDSLRELGWTRNEQLTGPALTHQTLPTVTLHIFNKNLFVNYRDLFPQA